MKDLTRGNPTKLIFAFAIPILIGNILQLAYNLIDTRIVGQTLGEAALAGVGATNSINTLIIGFLQGITNGFAVVIAQKFGAKNKAELKQTIAVSLVLGVITSLGLTAVSLLCLRPLLTVLNTPEEVIDLSYEFIQIIFMGMTITMLYNICAGFLRAIGDTVMPLVFLAVSVLLNIVGDYFFILNVGLGVRGAAIATVLSQCVAMIACAIYMVIRYDIFRLRGSDFKFTANLIRKLYSSGLSMGFMMSIVSLGTVALQGAINTFGTSIIVAHTAARKITEFFMILFSVFGVTMATYCGQNLGAGEVGRIKTGIRTALKFTWMWCVVVIVMAYTAAPQLVQMVTGSSDPIIIGTAAKYLRIDTLFYFVPAVITIVRNAMQGIGDYRTPIISSSIELIGKVCVVIFLVPVLGYMGVILAEPIVWILMVIPLVVQLKRNPVLKAEK